MDEGMPAARRRRDLTPEEYQDIMDNGYPGEYSYDTENDDDMSDMW